MGKHKVFAGLCFSVAVLFCILVNSEKGESGSRLSSTSVFGRKSRKSASLNHIISKKIQLPKARTGLDAVSDSKSRHVSTKHDPAVALDQQRSQPFTVAPGVSKVKVDIYLESQGSASQVLTEWVIGPVVAAMDVDKIVDLRIYAWGNAHLMRPDNTISSADVNIEAVLRDGTPKFLCEHGPSECEGNAWINCLQDQYPDLHQWFLVFTCMETLSCSDTQAPVQDSIVGTGSVARIPCRGTPGEVVGGCLQEYGPELDVDKLKQCVSGERGARLLLESMQKTAALLPPMDHVPWFVVDGRVLNSPNRTDAFLLGKTICDAYADKVKAAQHLSAGDTVSLPQGCLFFPSAPPYFDVSNPVNQFGINLLWIVVGCLFGVSVTMLGCWKYYNSKDS